jgi:phosphoenolpyruvate carboxylase
MLPGWFGFGSAVAGFIARHGDEGLARLQGLYRTSPFFQVILSNMEQVLAKADLGIARRFAALVETGRWPTSCLARLKRNGRRRRCLLCHQRPEPACWANPTLHRSLETRLPYLDALNLLQADLLQRLRANPDDAEALYAIHLTINGTSAGLRNSG